MRPRVFVSSVMEGFEEYRQAARNGIIAAGAEPVLVEDFSALPVSPRNACLDAVESCDILIIIVGSRGGWTTPSGKLVVEEEYEEALRRKVRILFFIQDIDRDNAAERFVKTLSDYIGGILRPTFKTPAELQTTVEDALKSLVNNYTNPKVDLSVIQEKISNAQEFEVYNEACLRFVLAPEREGELIDHIYIGSEELIEQIYNLGHSTQVRLFSYERPKKSEIGINELVILQSDPSQREECLDEVRLEITVNGLIIIDANVTGRVARRAAYFADSFYIYEKDIISVLEKFFAFSSVFYSEKDPYLRYDRFYYNIGLSGVGNKNLVSNPPQGNSHSLARQIDEVILAFDQPRLINRSDLANPENEIKRIVTFFQRRLKR